MLPFQSKVVVQVDELSQKTLKLNCPNATRMQMKSSYHRWADNLGSSGRALSLRRPSWPCESWDRPKHKMHFGIHPFDNWPKFFHLQNQWPNICNRPLCPGKVSNCTRERPTEGSLKMQNKWIAENHQLVELILVRMCLNFRALFFPCCIFELLKYGKTVKVARANSSTIWEAINFTHTWAFFDMYSYLNR